MIRVEERLVRLDGEWVAEGRDEIDLIIENHLELIGRSPDGWDSLFRHRDSQRLWQLTYPDSHLQGGGPRLLEELENTDAEAWMVEAKTGYRSTSPMKLNIRNADGQFLCPVCGYPGQFRGDSYDARGGVIGSGVCPCCLWQPGHDDQACGGVDDILDRVRQHRTEWRAAGMLWSGTHQLVPGRWCGETQLRELFRIASWVE